MSGGIDSVAMVHLFSEGKFNFGIAHCNFKLRGNESDEDEKFVKKLSEKFYVPFFSATFDTGKYAEEKKISIQMAARELRYEWFEKVRKENGFDFIVTAHHLNDSIETVLMNIIRGTGINGLHGILPKQDKIIRPLLFAKRSEIEKFVSANNIEFRTDVSNESDKYVRNKIRNQIILLFKEINPSFEETMLENMERMKSVEKVYQQGVTSLRKKLLEFRGKEIFIPIRKLQKIFPSEFLVYEMLKEFNFNFHQVQQIVQSFESEPGKVFLSDTHRLLKDRNFLIISPMETDEITYSLIEENQKEVVLADLKLKIKVVENKNFQIPDKPEIACLDFEQLEFPLKIRRWSKGDYFYPLGMKKKKKLSDFFIDRKLPLAEKEKVWVLFSGEKVVWVVNHRIDERFKITDKTKKIYTLEYQNQ